MGAKLRLCAFVISVFFGCAAVAQTGAPEPAKGTIVGTVTDVRNDIVPGVTVSLEDGSTTEKRTEVTNENGFFEFDNVKPGIRYHVTVSGTGFAEWKSPALTLKPSQYLHLTGIQLQLAVAVTTVTAAVDTVELATEQEQIEEKQRVLGFIPNFYVVYDKNAAPLTPKLKFRLALKTSLDPITVLGSAFVAAIDQAGNTPDYGQGWGAYGQRFGANYANGLTDILVGGAILPSLLHQDPRYFYQGTGTKKSRTLHALQTPFICKGDNGRWQPNFSSLGGYLASGAIANTYYPDKDRGVGLVFSQAGIDIAADMANGLIQEFILRKLTPSAKNRN
jgi:hypothetical protein